MLVICGLSEDSYPEDVRWDLTVVWVCISLVSDAEHLSMRCWPSVGHLWKMSIQVFCPFQNQGFFFFFDVGVV